MPMPLIPYELAPVRKRSAYDLLDELAYCRPNIAGLWWITARPLARALGHHDIFYQNSAATVRSSYLVIPWN